MKKGYLASWQDDQLINEIAVEEFSTSSEDSNWTVLPWTLGTSIEIWNCVKPPPPFASWAFNEIYGKWVSPVPYPLDGKLYNWDEATTNWIEVTNE